MAIKKLDIETLKKKRQLNVFEQNFLRSHEIRECAIAYRSGKPFANWVKAALVQSGLDPDGGILISACTVPCGGGEAAAYAEWVAADRSFYSIEATVALATLSFISLNSVKNVTASAKVDNHARGIGKSDSYLALEVLDELMEAKS